jgi:hypothetical protein
MPFHRDVNKFEANLREIKKGFVITGLKRNHEKYFKKLHTNATESMLSLHVISPCYLAL